MKDMILNLNRQVKKLEEIQEESRKKIDFEKALLNTTETDLYETKLKLLHITRIYILALHHFPRLRNGNPDNLTPEDTAELKKWIGRAKSADGLQDIVNALSELSKYYPKDIKSNLYGLVQKIIMGGAYRVKKEEKKK